MDVTDINPTGSQLPLLLLVEDNPDDAQLLREAFRERAVGLRCITASTANMAYSVLRLLPSNGLPRLIVMDLGLPGVSGHEVLRGFDADPCWRHIPKVVLTASQLDSDRTQSLERGAIAHLLKPSAFNDYLDLVDSLHPWIVAKPPPMDQAIQDLRMISQINRWMRRP